MSDNTENIKFEPDTPVPDWNVKDNIRFDLKAPSEIHDQRMELCKSCDKLNSVKFCQECGCFMPIKTWLKNSSCPIKKW